MPLDLALLSILTGSNYPCLELIFMAPNVIDSYNIKSWKLIKFNIDNYKGNYWQLKTLKTCN